MYIYTNKKEHIASLELEKRILIFWLKRLGFTIGFQRISAEKR